MITTSRLYTMYDRFHLYPYFIPWIIVFHVAGITLLFLRKKRGYWLHISFVRPTGHLADLQVNNPCTQRDIQTFLGDDFMGIP